MRFLSMEKDRKAAIKTLAGLSVNMAAAWYGLVFVSPNFWPVEGGKEIGILMFDLIFGTLCLCWSFSLERKLL